MKKLLYMAWKDLRLVFRDKAALVFMLAAPFALTIGLGMVSGRLSGSGSNGIKDIPVVIVNQDGGQLGNSLVEMFQSTDLNELVKPEVMTDEKAAKALVDDDKTTAAVIIPAGFTESIIPSGSSTTAGPLVKIQLYSNPTRPTTVGIINSILEEYLSRLEIGKISGEVAVTQLISSGLITPQQAGQVGAEIGTQQASQISTISVKTSADGEANPVQFDVLAIMAPGMALMFLMFTASNGGRSLLAERAQGTLPRLLVSPTTFVQVLGGKVAGIITTGVLQMLVLIIASALLFKLQWGNPLIVFLLVVVAVFAATGWGMLITAVAKTPGQVSAIGSAIMLTFGILGGTFLNMDYMPAWFRAISLITPNAWGLEGFTTLANGGALRDIAVPLLALLVMGAVLFFLAVVLLNRRDISRS